MRAIERATGAPPSHAEIKLAFELMNRAVAGDPLLPIIYAQIDFVSAVISIAVTDKATAAELARAFACDLEASVLKNFDHYNSSAGALPTTPAARGQ